LLSPFKGHFEVHSGPSPAQLGSLTAGNDGRPIFVGASSFGIGGTNGAIVLMEGPSREQMEHTMMEDVENGNISSLINSSICHWQIFPISAASKQSLKDFAEKLAGYIQVDMEKWFQKS
jgi:acyl transferase domain-containing protein